MDVAATIQNIITAGKDLVLQRFGAREQVLRAARALIASLETPSEKIFRLAYAEQASYALLRIAVDLDIFATLKAAGDSGLSAKELSAPHNADPVFVDRALRHLAAMDIVREGSTLGTYRSTTFSDSLTEDPYRSGIIYTYDVLGPSLRRLPDYMRSTSYKNPFDPADGPFQFAHDTKAPFFAFLAQHENYMTDFNNYMVGYRAGKPNWLDAGRYNVNAALKRDAEAEKDNAAVLVDVGGGMGQDMLLLREHPAVNGRLVLQDLAKVIEQIKSLPEEIEREVHDFFTPQPEKGARAYYLHSVLHDWDDASCVRILENLKPAMRAGYSKILIHDFVVPDSGATWPTTAMDLGMMVLGSVKERTETDWRRLFKEAGLEAVAFTTIEAGSESIIEVVLPA